MVIQSIEDGSLQEGHLLESVSGGKVSEEATRTIFAGLQHLALLALRQPNLKAEVLVVASACFEQLN